MVDFISDGGESLYPGQEIGSENEEPNVDPQDQGVHRGERTRTPREMYVASVRRKKTSTKER